MRGKDKTMMGELAPADGKETHVLRLAKSLKVSEESGTRRQLHVLSTMKRCNIWDVKNSLASGTIFRL
jgi:hypothetical protein